MIWPSLKSRDQGHRGPNKLTSLNVGLRTARVGVSSNFAATFSLAKLPAGHMLLSLCYCSCQLTIGILTLSGQMNGLMSMGEMITVGGVAFG